MRKKGKPVIECNKCRRILSAKPKWKKSGDIEYYYLECVHCKAIYVISATDTALRQSIKHFKEMNISTEKESQEAKELLKANIERSREIKEQYPLKSN